MLDFNTNQFPVSQSYLEYMRNERKKLSYNKPRSYKFLSRYTNTERIEDNKNGVSYHETFDKKEIPETNADQYYTVDVTTENRLDIVSNKFYGYSLYWWIIAMANDIIDPFDVPAGSVIRIPQVASIYMSGSVLG